MFKEILLLFIVLIAALFIFGGNTINSSKNISNFTPTNTVLHHSQLPQQSVQSVQSVQLPQQLQPILQPILRPEIHSKRTKHIQFAPIVAEKMYNKRTGAVSGVVSTRINDI
jgi:predicted PurR-regulated permease PerM